MNAQKGMSMALTIVITLVVLIIVAVVSVKVATNNISKAGAESEQTQDRTFNGLESVRGCIGDENCDNTDDAEGPGNEGEDVPF